jgi:hypothetical protein
MHCSQCGNQLEAGAKFCTSCGAKLNDEVAATKGIVAQPSSNFQDNEYVKQGKQISKQYFGYALTALKSPMNASRKVTSNDKVNGFITFILFSLLLPLFSYFTMSGFSSGYGYGMVDIPFGDTVIKPFFILAIFLLVLTSVMFVVTKLMKVSLSFFDVLTRYATFLIVPTALLVVAVLFSIISVYFFGFLFFILALFAFFVASISTLHSVKEDSEGGLDVFYGIIATNIIMVIILLIIGDSIIGNLMNQMPF